MDCNTFRLSFLLPIHKNATTKKEETESNILFIGVTSHGDNTLHVSLKNRGQANTPTILRRDVFTLFGTKHQSGVEVEMPEDKVQLLVKTNREPV